MTTIAWDGITIAHDSQSTAGAFVLFQQRKLNEIYESGPLKCFQDETPRLLICSGGKGDSNHAMHFMRNCTQDGVLELHHELSFCAWVFTQEGHCWAIHKQEGESLPSVYEVLPPAAAGSGHDIAMTAMYLGKDAKEAVFVAGKLDCYTDTDVKSRSFKYGEVMK